MSDVPIDATTILTRERLLKAVRTSRGDLFTPMDRDTMRRQAEHPDLCLTEAEREVISAALVDSYRLVSGFAYQTLKRYDDLFARDRAEALDLFADIVHYPYFTRRGVILRAPEPGIER